MIKNIVFDLGNVLVTFDPKSFLHDILQDPTLESKFYEFYFTGNLWNQYDMNILTHEDMIQKGMDAFPDYKEEIEKVMSKWVCYVTEIEENTAWINRLKQRGCSIFILSNLPEYNYRYLMEHSSFMKEVDGALYSFEIQKGKPDVDFYQFFLERYSLIGDECLFIDDKKENIDSAENLGFKTILLKDPKQFSKEIVNYLE